MTTTIYTDGACSGNPGPGGWAWAIEGGAFKSGPDRVTTNQRMELMAVLDAVQSNEGSLEIVSDSTYVVNCFRDKWHVGWLKRGWVNSKNQPVANRDIWEPLIKNVTTRKNVSFRWVKGHSGHPMNDLVDRLAVEAARSQRGASSDGEAPLSDTSSTRTPSPSTASSNTIAPSPAATTAKKATPKRAPPARPSSEAEPSTRTNSANYVVIFRAKLHAEIGDDYGTTATRMRELALHQFGCVDFQAVCEGDYEVALSYWRDLESILTWKQHAEHLLAQKRGQSAWYESYRVEVTRLERCYNWPA